MTKLGKLERRRIWTIYALLDGKVWLNEELMDYLNDKEDYILSEYIEEEKDCYRNGMLPDLISSGYEPADEMELTLEKVKCDLEKPENKISKGMFTRVHKSLTNEGIIKQVPTKKKGRGPPPEAYCLVDSLDALEKILNIFYDDSKVPLEFSVFLGIKFISSSYAKKQIQILLEAVNEKMKFSFSEIEKEAILNMLFISPRAILFTLDYLKKLTFIRIPLTFEYEYKGDVEIFLFSLQLKLGEDIMQLTLPKNFKNFEYKITVSFTDEQFGKKNISKQLGKNIVQTCIIPKYSEEAHMNSKSNIDFSPL